MRLGRASNRLSKSPCSWRAFRCANDNDAMRARDLTEIPNPGLSASFPSAFAITLRVIALF
jgi:hypothetical protein